MSNYDLPEIEYHDLPRDALELEAIIKHNMRLAVAKDRQASEKSLGSVWRRFESNMLSPNYGQWGPWKTGPINEAGGFQRAEFYAAPRRAKPVQVDVQMDDDRAPSHERPKG